MNSDYSPLFHQASKQHGRGHPPISKNPDDWPKEWKTIEYKTYPRLRKVPLPQGGHIETPITEAIKGRVSKRSFGSESASLQQLGSFLQHSVGLVDKDKFRRAHPSGGARFPVESYPILFRGGEGYGSGVYHYDIQEHSLTLLRERAFSDGDIDSLFRYEWVKGAAGAIVLTGLFERTQRKYGERGYRYILLEAGHIAQNMCLLAHPLQLKACPVTGMNDSALETLIDIDGIGESVLYSVVFGI